MMEKKLLLPTQTNSYLLNELPYCEGCHKPITERFLLKALNKLWHEDCLRCSCCDCRLGEVGSKLFFKAKLLLCQTDYLRLFGRTGVCSACEKTIPGFELVMKVKGKIYHLDCFACQICNHSFCIGDRFYLHEERILCEYDYNYTMMNTRNLQMDYVNQQQRSLPSTPTTPPANNQNVIKKPEQQIKSEQLS